MMAPKIVVVKVVAKFSIYGLICILAAHVIANAFLS